MHPTINLCATLIHSGYVLYSVFLFFVFLCPGSFRLGFIKPAPYSAWFRSVRCFFYISHIRGSYIPLNSNTRIPIKSFWISLILWVVLRPSLNAFYSIILLTLGLLLTIASETLLPTCPFFFSLCHHLSTQRL